MRWTRAIGSIITTHLAVATCIAASPCPPARYALVEPIGSDAAPIAIIDIGDDVALSGVCATTPAHARPGGKGRTRVRARWSTCTGFAAPVRLRATIDDGCEHLTGTLRASTERSAFTAARVDCGDGILDATPPPVPYAATVESLATHALPGWFDDAKFGIMIHWGLFSIPAWAETILDPEEWLRDLSKLLEPPLFGAEWFAHIPYVEWYPNTMLIEGSPTQAHHHATYGIDFPYTDFRTPFETSAAAWSPEPWAALFRTAGARYVVLVTKHHDGFALWPTEVPHPTRPGWHATRDFVGELDAAVRRNCLRMGTYYSGGLDWSVQPGPIRNTLDILTVAPQSDAYIAYADAQWRELVTRYRPAVMWNDLGYPPNAEELALFADFYNTVPDGVVNDRFVTLPPYTHHDYVTPEFNVPDTALAEKFETVRGMDRGFGYNRNSTEADYTPALGLIEQLVDVVSKNGNLLLNVGPMADGTIPAPQVERLHAIGAWLGVNGAAIFATRPWTRAEGTTSTGLPVRFTASQDGTTVYAIVMGEITDQRVTIEALDATVTRVRLLGARRRPRWQLTEQALTIELREPVAGPGPHAFAITLGE